MTSLRDGIEEFLASLAVERGLAANTVAAYRRDLAAYAEAMGGEFPSAGRVIGYVAELYAGGLAASTVARRVAAIKGLHRFLIAERYTDEDPTALLDSPRLVRSLPKALTVDEVRRLLEAPDVTIPLGRRDRALLEFLYATGARVSEATALDLQDVDLEDRVVTVTGKGSKQRRVPLGGFAVAALNAYLPDRLHLKGDRPDPGAVFLNSRGSRISRQGVWLIVRRQGRRAGLDERRLSPHVLRHSTATHMVEGGADLRTVQELLGHASISTTQVYTKVSPQHLYEVYIMSHPRSRKP